MSIHWVRIVHSGHQSTARLFDLCLSLRACRRDGHWPSLGTLNAFLALGTDDGELGTDIEWEPCELSQSDYDAALAVVMAGKPYKLDAERQTWEEWLKRSAAGDEA